MKGLIHSIETFGSVDGPGIRFVIFTQGCAMRCRYCHNVDTWDPSAGNRVTADELLDQAERYRAYWGPEGGITVSGGEPLLQIDFLLELFQKAKARGIHTCIDTSGQPFTRREPFFSKFQTLMEHTDLLLMDVKHIDPARHIRLTGKPNDNIRDCFRYLSETGKPVWVRQVLAPGWTDSDEYLARTRAFLETLNNVQKIEVLPYHSLGAYKWEQLGLTYPMKGVEPPAAKQTERAQRILRGEEKIPNLDFDQGPAA